MNKIYMIIYDGGGDRPISSLSGKTPFEAAHTPTLDWLATNGSQSLISIIDADIPPESDSGSMALLSYDPLVYYRGRGPLEALGAGLIHDDAFNASFRVNFACYGNNKLDRRTARGLSNDELQALTKSLNEQVDLSDYLGTTFKLISYRNHRGIITFYNSTIQLSGNVSYTDPGFERKGYFGINAREYEPIPRRCVPLNESEAASHVANIINLFVERSYIVLQDHPINQIRISENKLPANYLLIRDGGDFPVPMTPFAEKFHKALSIYGQLSAEKALADLLGAKFAYSRLGEHESEVTFFANLIGSLISDDADVIFAHMKGPDEPGHDNQPYEKVSAIEALDHDFLAHLVKSVDATDVIVVTCDHATPCELKLHSSDKVPLVAYGGKITPDHTEKFGESYSLHGSFPVSKAIDLLDTILSMNQ